MKLTVPDFVDVEAEDSPVARNGNRWHVRLRKPVM